MREGEQQGVKGVDLAGGVGGQRGNEGKHLEGSVDLQIRSDLVFENHKFFKFKQYKAHEIEDTRAKNADVATAKMEHNATRDPNLDESLASKQKRTKLVPIEEVLGLQGALMCGSDMLATTKDEQYKSDGSEDDEDDNGDIDAPTTKNNAMQNHICGSLWLKHKRTKLVPIEEVLGLQAAMMCGSDMLSTARDEQYRADGLEDYKADNGEIAAPTTKNNAMQNQNIGESLGPKQKRTKLVPIEEVLGLEAAMMCGSDMLATATNEQYKADGIEDDEADNGDIIAPITKNNAIQNQSLGVSLVPKQKRTKLLPIEEVLGLQAAMMCGCDMLTTVRDEYKADGIEDDEANNGDVVAPTTENNDTQNQNIGEFLPPKQKRTKLVPTEEVLELQAAQMYGSHTLTTTRDEMDSIFGDTLEIFSNNLATWKYANGSSDPLATEEARTKDDEPGDGHLASDTTEAQCQNLDESLAPRPKRTKLVPIEEVSRLQGALMCGSDTFATGRDEDAKASKIIPPEDLWDSMEILPVFGDVHLDDYYRYLVEHPNIAGTFYTLDVSEKLVWVAGHVVEHFCNIPNFTTLKYAS